MDLHSIIFPSYRQIMGDRGKVVQKFAENRNGSALFYICEELCTTLVQIEACLNSRTLYTLSNDPI